jgi:cobalt-zinc-cadmium efflux system membrane fusion protein
MKTKHLLSPLCAALALAFSVHVMAVERQAKFPVTEQQMLALNIQTEELKRDAAPVVLSLPAQVTVPSNREQIVSTPLAGLAVELYVQPNQVVRQGAALLRLVVPELGPLQLQLMQASNRATLARQAAQREKALFSEGIIAQRRVQEAQAALADSEAGLAQAKAALRLAGLPAAAIGRIAASGQLEDGLTLRAARAGIVTSIEVKPGQRVEPANALLHVAQTDRLALEIQAPAADAAAWRAGGKLKLQGRAGSATIVSVSPTVVSGSQTVAIRAELDGAAAGLRPGEFVTVQLPLSADSASWDVPLAALAHEGNQAYVFVRGTTGFEARPVKVVGSAGQRVRIQGALKGGERIAVSGVVALKGTWLGEKGGS